MATRTRLSVLLIALWLIAPLQALAEQPATLPAGTLVFARMLQRIARLLEPSAAQHPLTTTCRVVLAEPGGKLPAQLRGLALDLAWQAPDRLRVAGRVGDEEFIAARSGQEIWVYAPRKHFGIIGAPGLPRFASDPDSIDRTVLGPIRLPFPAERLNALALAFYAERGAPEPIQGQPCDVLLLTPLPAARQLVDLPEGKWRLWVRRSDRLPARVEFIGDGQGQRIAIEFQNWQAEAWADDRWSIPAQPEDKIERVAVSHLIRFARVLSDRLGDSTPPLGPATGQRRVVAAEGAGRLEMRDGTRVLFLKGSPEEMGRQQGTLLKTELRQVAERIVWGAGVASSFAKGSWFFGEIERADARLAPYFDPRYAAEIDAMAVAAGIEPRAARLANVFPELFHCSGFALYGSATAGGRLYHGRILDYMRGIGLEQNAVVMVYQPDYGHAWVNIGYAGFIGSVTAMNEKHIAIGEMGGRGEGNWDGVPMAQLVRKVMEEAGSLDDALRIMRQSKRTCEYYYVISDGNSKRAVGIHATPEVFETIWPGEAHPLLSHPMKDAVLMSAGQRYEELASRVGRAYGRIDEQVARELMTRPVAMNSNIHSALFAPETLDFWVANADSEHVASEARFTKYNLRELLGGR